MQRKLILTLFLLFLSTLNVFAGGPSFYSVNIGAPTIACTGDVSISFSLEWNYALFANWEIIVDGILINSGTVNEANPIDSFTVTGVIVPKNDPSVTVQLHLLSTQGNTYDQFHTFFISTSTCPSTGGDDSPVVVICDDGRLNPQCDLVAIYAIEDGDGVHMQVWYVLPGDGINGQFAFMLYQDELDALADNPSEALLVASSEDNFVKLYWMPDNSFQIHAGPDAEGKTRVFTFSTFPGEVSVYTQE